MAQLHTDNIFKSMKDMKFEETISHECGVTMNDSVESRAIAEVMAEKPGVKVTYAGDDSDRWRTQNHIHDVGDFRGAWAGDDSVFV